MMKLDPKTLKVRADPSCLVVPLTAADQGMRNVPGMLGWQITLYAEPQRVVQLATPAYDRRLRIWDELACTDLRIADTSLFACTGWIRVHDALRLACGQNVRPGMLVEMRLLHIAGAGGFLIPPLGWYAVEEGRP